MMVPTASKLIESKLVGVRQFEDYRANRTSPSQFSAWVQQQSIDDLEVLGLTLDQVSLATRVPRDRAEFAERALAELRRRGIIHNGSHDAARFEQHFHSIENLYDHCGRTTYIFPEEAEILFAVAATERPKTAVFMGSYYGYWAVWLKAALGSGCRVHLIDIDPAAVALSQENFRRLGYLENTDFLVANAISYVKEMSDIDMVVLDAEGPKDDSIDSDMRDKAIYYPMLKAVLPAMTTKSILISHNTLLEDVSNVGYFRLKQEANLHQYAKFLPLVREEFHALYIESSEAMMVGRRRQAPVSIEP